MTRESWSRVLLIAGLVGMLTGAADPLEGSIIVLPAAAVCALGAFLGQYGRRKWVYLGFVLLTAGIGAMFALSAIGGVGGPTGRPLWWALVVLPYPAGWILEMVGAVSSLARPA